MKYTFAALVLAGVTHVAAGPLAARAGCVGEILPPDTGNVVLPCQSTCSFKSPNKDAGTQAQATLNLAFEEAATMIEAVLAIKGGVSWNWHGDWFTKYLDKGDVELFTRFMKVVKDWKKVGSKVQILCTNRKGDPDFMQPGNAEPEQCSNPNKDNHAEVDHQGGGTRMAWTVSKDNKMYLCQNLLNSWPNEGEDPTKYPASLLLSDKAGHSNNDGGATALAVCPFSFGGFKYTPELSDFRLLSTTIIRDFAHSKAVIDEVNKRKDCVDKSKCAQYSVDDQGLHQKIEKFGKSRSAQSLWDDSC